MGKILEESATPWGDMGDGSLNLPPVNAVLTASEACTYLRISKWTLYRLIGTGQIKTMKVFSRRLIRRQALEDYMKEREAEEG